MRLKSVETYVQYTYFDAPDAFVNLYIGWKHSTNPALRSIAFQLADYILELAAFCEDKEFVSPLDWVETRVQTLDGVELIEDC
jgi:hypothetical protein